MAPPTLLITRPIESARAFVASLDAQALAGVQVVIAPLMEISGTGNVPVLEAGQGVIFTSANGVKYAGDGAGRPAYCVGAQTTQQAAARGWAAQQAGDTAQELIATLLTTPPAGPLLHLAGEHTRGDVAGTLSAAGITTDYIALYTQTLLPLDASARTALDGPCIVPVFSPRSAAHLLWLAQGRLDRAHIVALSEAVAAPFSHEKLAQLVELPAPRALYMRKAVENLCKTLGLP